MGRPTATSLLVHYPEVKPSATLPSPLPPDFSKDSLVSLPAELIELILDDVEDFDDLKACSLTCSGLLPFARLRLFAVANMRDIQHVMCANNVPDLCQCSRELTIRDLLVLQVEDVEWLNTVIKGPKLAVPKVTSYLPWKAKVFKGIFPPIFKALSRVTTLEIHNIVVISQLISNICVPNIDPRYQETIMKLFAQITTLRLAGCKFDGLDPLLTFLRLFPALRTLQLYDTFTKPGVAPNMAGTSISDVIRHLQLDNSPMPRLSTLAVAYQKKPWELNTETAAEHAALFEAMPKQTMRELKLWLPRQAPIEFYTGILLSFPKLQCIRMDIRASGFKTGGEQMTAIHAVAEALSTSEVTSFIVVGDVWVTTLAQASPLVSAATFMSRLKDLEVQLMLSYSHRVYINLEGAAELAAILCEEQEAMPECRRIRLWNRALCTNDEFKFPYETLRGELQKCKEAGTPKVRKVYRSGMKVKIEDWTLPLPDDIKGELPLVVLRFEFFVKDDGKAGVLDSMELRYTPAGCMPMAD